MKAQYFPFHGKASDVSLSPDKDPPVELEPTGAGREGFVSKVNPKAGGLMTDLWP